MALSLLAIIVLGLGGSLLGLMAMLRGAWMRNRWFQLAPVAVALVAALLALGGDHPLQALMPLGLIGFWAAWCWGESALAFLNRNAAELHRPWVAGASLMVVSPLLAVLWSHLAVAEPDYWEPPTLPETVAEIKRLKVQNVNVTTDLGRHLPVTIPARSATPDEIQLINQQVVPGNLIRTDEPGANYNCHGWVFTGGKYWIHSGHVTTILDDNGYRPVAEPHAGDLIVYWSRNKVLHTGIVRSVLGKQVLIESKWGMQGRFIHTAENQDYSQEFSYYRSDRSGHLLREHSEGEERDRPVFGSIAEVE